MMRRKLWLDVDTGIDDTLALLYAVASNDADLVGVSCSAGNVEVELVARNTAAVLALAGRGDIPVHVGRKGPIGRPLRTTPETHGPEGVGYAAIAGLPTPGLTSSDAVTALCDAVSAAPGEIHLVTLGPLTNIAAAVLREPALPGLLASMHVMGGCFRGTGNTAPRTEWNIHVDPEAAQVVLHAWGGGLAEELLPAVVGLDVTEAARLLPEHVGALLARGGAAPTVRTGPSWPMDAALPDGLPRTLVDALRFYFEFHAEYDGFYGAFIHDPFVVAAALDPGLIEVRPVTVDVEVSARLTSGETVADWRGHWGRPANARVAVRGDAAMFIDRMIERVGALFERVAS
jgi:purine nucleosidase